MTLAQEHNTADPEADCRAGLGSAGGRNIPQWRWPGAGLMAMALALPAVAAPAPAAWKANCQVCHQAEGQGLAGQFPRLTGRTAAIAVLPAGRAYLASVVTHGLAGRIVVDGTAIIGVMPGFAALSDAELAAALSYAARGGTAAPFKPAEIAAARKTPMKNSAMTTLRAQLVTDGTIP